jgi:mannosyltransferase OCH1-like enzyme
MSDFLANVDHPIDNSAMWKLLEQDYDRYYYNHDGSKDFTIPKKIHHVWLGSKFPDSYKRIRDTWITMHPDWEYKCWTDEDVDNIDMINREAFDTVENLGAKSDILRYEILKIHGGLYIDTDFECIKPFDDLMYLDFIGGSGWTANPNVFNGLIACCPNNMFINDVIARISLKKINKHYNLGDILHVTGADFITKVYYAYRNRTKDRCVVFPKNFFYAFPPELRFGIRGDDEMDRELIYSYITPKTYCLHLWYTSWQK